MITKISARCDQGAVNLAREVVAACLAGDLGLPIPQPYLVELSPRWVASVADTLIQGDLRASLPVAFGSRLAGSQFTAWHPGTRLQPSMMAMALAIFVFDAVIQNLDRRDGNPNCLVRGDELRIIDHELAFTHRLVIGWKPPWETGGLQDLVAPGRHIFRDKLRRQALNFDPVRQAWASLPDGRIDGYATTLPVEWEEAAADVTAALRLIKEARDHMDECLTEIRRVLI